MQWILEKKRRKNLAISILSKDIKTLEELHKYTGSKLVYKQLLAKQKALEAIDSQKIQKDLMCSKLKLWGGKAHKI